jgi:hypothetical protein
MRSRRHVIPPSALLGRALLAALACTVPATVPCEAQTSASFKLTESTVDGGGNPTQGSVLTAPHFHLKFDAIGDALAGAGLASGSFHVDGGFVGRYPPPGEVTGLIFTSKTSLGWSSERSVGSYDLYRDLLSSLPGTSGACYQPGLAATSWTEAASPAAGNGWFYLVTAENRLNEEGTKGFRSGGAERGNAAACP